MRINNQINNPYHQNCKKNNFTSTTIVYTYLDRKLQHAPEIVKPIAERAACMLADESTTNTIIKDARNYFKSWVHDFKFEGGKRDIGTVIRTVFNRKYWRACFLTGEDALTLHYDGGKPLGRLKSDVLDIYGTTRIGYVDNLEYPKDLSYEITGVKALTDQRKTYSDLSQEISSDFELATREIFDPKTETYHGEKLALHVCAKSSNCKSGETPEVYYMEFRKLTDESFEPPPVTISTIVPVTKPIYKPVFGVDLKPPKTKAKEKLPIPSSMLLFPGSKTGYV